MGRAAALPSPGAGDNCRVPGPLSPTEAGSRFDKIIVGFMSEKSSGADLHLDILSFLYFLCFPDTSRIIISFYVLLVFLMEVGISVIH